MVALDTPLKNGQVVEIITQKQAKPSRDWLKFVRTQQAQNRVRQWLNKNRIDFAAIEGTKKEPAKPEVQKAAAGKATALAPVVEVAGDPKIATVLAKCCHPQPPEPIVGYITLDHRLTVHHRDCRNLAKIKDTSRLVNVNWKKQ